MIEPARLNSPLQSQLAQTNSERLYNDQWSCPITPFENRINVPIRAGEKILQGEWAKLGYQLEHPPAH
ncbi:MAG: DUF1684 domain-containing protein [Anaerolineales bacterium]